MLAKLIKNYKRGRAKAKIVKTREVKALEVPKKRSSLTFKVDEIHWKIDIGLFKYQLPNLSYVKENSNTNIKR